MFCKSSKNTKVISAVIGSLALITLTLAVKAATNIDSISRYAWDDIGGWWDFYSTDSVTVGTSTLYGYASSSLGYLALNCDSTPNGNICASSNFKVCNGDWDGSTCTNTGQGALSGCAWNDTIGWVSFSCKSYDCGGFGGSHDICSQSPYWVGIDSSGNFGGVTGYSGYAWNDTVGWIGFSGFASSVKTSWTPGRIAGYLESSIIDTESASGATLNSITWQGTQSLNAPVDFQVAVSNNQNGPWTFYGPGASTLSYFGGSCPSVGQGNTSPNVPICIDSSQVANYRYLRYKIRLQSDPGQSTTSLVTDVILNFSP